MAGVGVAVGVGLSYTGQGSVEHETAAGGGPALVGVLVGGAVAVRVVDGVSVMLGVAVLVAGFVCVGEEVHTLVTVDVGGAVPVRVVDGVGVVLGVAVPVAGLV